MTPSPTRATAEAIAEPLLEVLRDAFSPEVAYASPPRLLGDGVTARAFALRLSGVPPEMAGELVCRLFYPAGTMPPDQFPVEEALHNALVEQEFPVPRVFAAGAAGSALGAPFMLMERVAGRDIFGAVVLGLCASVALALGGVYWPLALFFVGYWAFMVRMLVRLHSLSGEAVLARMERAGVSRARLSLDRLLDHMDTDVRREGLSVLQPLVDWLRTNRPEPPTRPVVCHGDFWLGNVLVGPRRATLLDWTQAAIGHREHDLGWLEIQRYSRMPLDLPIPEAIYDFAFTLGSPFSWSLLSANGWVYRLVNRVDRERLRYFTALNATKMLVQIVGLLAADAATRRRPPPELMAWGSRRTVRLLARRLRRITGIDVGPELGAMRGR